MSKKTRTGRGVDGRPDSRYGLTDDAWERIEPLLPRRDPAPDGTITKRRSTVTCLPRDAHTAA